jgi:hypothetical protein
MPPALTDLPVIVAFSASAATMEHRHVEYHPVIKAQRYDGRGFMPLGVDLGRASGRGGMSDPRKPMRQGLGVLPRPPISGGDRRRRLRLYRVELSQTRLLRARPEEKLRRALDGMARPRRSGRRRLSGGMRPHRKSRTRLEDRQRVLPDAISRALDLRRRAPVQKEGSAQVIMDR